MNHIHSLSPLAETFFKDFFFTSSHQVLKSKPKETPILKFLSLLGKRGTKLKLAQFEFWSYCGVWHTVTNICVKIYPFILWLLVIFEVDVVEKVLQ